MQLAGSNITWIPGHGPLPTMSCEVLGNKSALSTAVRARSHQSSLARDVPRPSAATLLDRNDATHPPPTSSRPATAQFSGMVGKGLARLALRGPRSDEYSESACGCTRCPA